MDYVPDDKWRYDQMLQFLRVAEDEQEFGSVVRLFLFDISYSRRDLSHALSTVEKERGWKL